MGQNVERYGKGALWLHWVMAVLIVIGTPSLLHDSWPHATEHRFVHSPRWPFGTHVDRGKIILGERTALARARSTLALPSRLRLQNLPSPIPTFLAGGATIPALDFCAVASACRFSNGGEA